MDEIDKAYNEFMAKQAREREDFDEFMGNGVNVGGGVNWGRARAVEEEKKEEEKKASPWGVFVVILILMCIPLIIAFSPALIGALIGLFIVAPIVVFLWDGCWALIATIVDDK